MNEIMYMGILLGAYVVGGLPTGYLIARLYGIVDIRDRGSGNMGATNVGRSLGAFPFMLVFGIDAGKAAAVLYLSTLLDITGIFLVGVVGSLLLGNCYTPFLGFRGGKGVATSVGMLMFLQPYFLLIILTLWLLAFIVTGTVGIASVMAALVTPMIAWLLYPCDATLVYASILVTAVIIVRHVSNIMHYFNKA